MKLIGKYEVIAEIGTGSMGAIYQARDRVLDRVVALKLLRGQADLDPELKERFYREARACAKLSHPNIITIYDLGEVEDAVFIAMELLSGSDLRKLVEESRTPSLGVKLDVMAQVCDALEHAHKKQIVHRDIKPSNIFLCDDQRAKILDFGIARIPTSNLTIVGKVLGSPNYMAPEQIRGRICDSRSDLFSAAIVFWEFLTGSHPFQSDNVPNRIVESPPDSLRTMNPTIPEALESLLLQAFEKDPKKRIQTAGELGAGIRTVLGGLSGAKAASLSQSPQPVAGKAAEQNVSGFLGAVSDFEEALGNRNTKSALEALVSMRGLAAMDDRFSVALADSEVRFKKMVAGSAKPTGAASKAADRPPSSKTGWNKNTLWLAAGAAVVIIIGAGIWFRSRDSVSADTIPVPPHETAATPAPAPAPAIATATVAVATANLLPAQTSISSPIATLRQGDIVNVIAMPGSREQEYTNVRVGDAKPGFVLTANLTNWSGVDSETAWSLDKLFAPAETAGEPELLAQREKWNQFTSKFPTAPQLAEAYLETVRLDLALIKLAKDSGKSAADWEAYSTHGREALKMATGTPAIETAAAQLRQQFPEPAAKVTIAPPMPEQLLPKISPLWEAGRYKEASRLAEQILAVSPGHPKALAWRKKIHDSEAAEAKAQ